MSLSKLSLNQSTTSNKIPDWLEKDAEYAYKLNFAISKEHFKEVFRAVKNSQLPEEVVNYLTSDGNFKGMLIAAGFEFTEQPTSSISNASEEYTYPCRYKHLLSDDYDFYFMNLIAPFVRWHSYLEFRKSSGEMFRLVFNEIQCNEVKPRIVWEY